MGCTGRTPVRIRLTIRKLPLNKKSRRDIPAALAIKLNSGYAFLIFELVMLHEDLRDFRS